MKEFEELVRPHILRLTENKTYSKGDEAKCKIRLNANENPYNSPYNRYPDPTLEGMKEKISVNRRVHKESIFVGNGISEVIDVVYRCFCEPRHDNVVAVTPTEPAFKRYAQVNDVEYREVALGEGFSLDADKVLEACDEKTKVVWLCSPNNPTGNDLDRTEIVKLIEGFDGMVVVDEAYADFSCVKPLRHELHLHSNLIVIDTFCHAWGCAALNVSMAYAAPFVIDMFNKIKSPYSIPQTVQMEMTTLLSKMYDVEKWIRIILMERDRMMEAFALLQCCKKVYPSAANFFLVEVKDADITYRYLLSKGIAVDNVSHMPLCDNCLRISIGSKTQNSELLAVLRG